MVTRRLLTIGHSYVVNSNRRLADAIRRSAGDRWEIHVAAPRYFHGSRDIRPVEFKPGAGEEYRVVPLPAHLTRYVHLFVYGRGIRPLLRENWDLIHCWDEPFVLAGAQVAVGAPANARFVFRTAQSLNKWYPPPFSWLEKYTVGRADGWICSGQLVAQNLLRRPEYRNRPMARIPLGVDVTAFRPDRDAGAAVRASLGWADAGPPVVGYLGRFVREKGIRVLTRALEMFRTKWRALFLGGGPLEAELRRWAAKYPDSVRVCTDVGHADVPKYLNAMDVLAAPSQTTPRWKEQFGRMLVEGFAAGVPVVGSDSGEIPYVIGDNGVVVPEADEAAWAAALGDLFESPARRADLAARGRAAACDQFAWEVVGRRHVEFFDRLFDSRPAAPKVMAGDLGP